MYVGGSLASTTTGTYSAGGSHRRRHQGRHDDGGPGRRGWRLRWSFRRRARLRRAESPHRAQGVRRERQSYSGIPSPSACTLATSPVCRLRVFEIAWETTRFATAGTQGGPVESSHEPADDRPPDDLGPAAPDSSPEPPPKRKISRRPSSPERSAPWPLPATGAGWALNRYVLDHVAGGERVQHHRLERRRRRTAATSGTEHRDVLPAATPPPISDHHGPDRHRAATR